MTVRQLREKLACGNDGTKVIVYWEDGKQHQVFEIDDVSLTECGPFRDKKGEARVRFGSGPAKWVFISVTPESE